jgi:hypothetical protein
MGNIDYNKKIEETCNKYEIILKMYISELESVIFPYGILYSGNSARINEDIIKMFFNYYEKVINMLYYIDNCYYITKMLFLADYILRSSPYIYFDIDFKLKEIIETLHIIEKQYFPKKI